MSTEKYLLSIASEPNWLSFAKALRATMRSASDYGFESTDQLLDEVARMRGVGVASLRNPLAAENWLERNAPEVHASENLKVSMTGVLLLSQISILSNDLSKELAPKVFLGEVNRSQLQAALEAAKTAAGGFGGVAHERPRKAEAFEELVSLYLSNNIEVLGFDRAAKLERCPRDAHLHCDIVVSLDGRPAMAIEVKAYRQKRHRRYLVEVLGLMSLLSRNYPKAMLIVPESWGASTEVLRELRDELNLDDVQLAAIDDHVAPEKARLRFLE